MAEQWEGEHGYAPKNHNHDDKYAAKDHAHDESASYIGMPDFKNMVMLERFLDSPYAPGADHAWTFNPGTIYKINVPGYIYCVSSSEYWSAENGVQIYVSGHPGALYHNQWLGDWTRGSYRLQAHIDKRAKFYQITNDPFDDNCYIPITPGTSTYIRLADLTSTPTNQSYWFVPCVGIADKYSEYFTRVGRGPFTLATVQEHYPTSNSAYVTTPNATGLNDIVNEAFGGNWMDNFNTDGTLDESKVIRLKGSYIGVGYTEHITETVEVSALDQPGTVHINDFIAGNRGGFYSLPAASTGWHVIDDTMKNMINGVSSLQVTLMKHAYISTACQFSANAGCHRYHLVDPMATGKDRVYWIMPTTYDWVMKYFTSEEVDAISANLLDNDRDTIQARLTAVGFPSNVTPDVIIDRMRERWCVVPNYWDTSNSLNKILTLAWMSLDANLEDPPTGMDSPYVKLDDYGNFTVMDMTDRTHMWFRGPWYDVYSDMRAWSFGLKFIEPTIDAQYDF